MADWRQIQARIRKAKTGADAAAKLAELYERTRDAMVAFELAQWQEKAGEHAEAARWYTAAAERFRRSQWKSKAEAALARLRSPASTATEQPPEGKVSQEASHPDVSEAPSELELVPDRGGTRPEAAGEQVAVGFVQRDEVLDHRAEDAGAAIGRTGVAPQQNAQPARPRSRRRGRRGGRNRRRSHPASSAPPGAASRIEQQVLMPAARPTEGPVLTSQASESRAATDAASQMPSVATWRGQSRAGEPALASRMAQLESQLRRLLACPQSKLDQAESAPAGPGVLLLSDSDQVSHYYVESCQTLRIAIGNLVRGGRGAKEMPRLKERLAENLGIAESRVTNYLKEHCAIRWLQLDEGANELAHFAIAVLRPVVNE